MHAVDSFLIRHSASPINWEELEITRSEIKGFLTSLNMNILGTGRVLYKKKEFKLVPRSAYFSNHTWQSMVTIFSEGASFGATQAAFVLLKQKVEFLALKIDIFHPRNASDCPPTAAQLLKKLIETETVIESVASRGLVRLCLNYETVGKSTEAASLRQFGTDSFTLIHQLTQTLTKKLLPHLPQLQNDIDLERCRMHAAKLLKKRDNYCDHFRCVIWDPAKGTVIPKSLMIACQKDLKIIGKLSRFDVRNAANMIHLSSQVKPIPAQGGSVTWRPLRPVGAEFITFEEGITGTCEREGVNSPNLCNVFYRFDRTGQLTISTGAIDSVIKGRQFVAVAKHIQHIYPTIANKPRWILHQLNSFYNEEELIYNVHKQVSWVEKLLDESAKTSCSFLHINTAFNSASKLASEDKLSLTNINLESLILLIQYAIEDATSLLDAKFTEKNEDWKAGFPLCSQLMELAYRIKGVKKEITELLLDPEASKILQKQINQYIDCKVEEISEDDSSASLSTDSNSSSDDLVNFAESPLPSPKLSRLVEVRSDSKSVVDLRHTRKTSSAQIREKLKGLETSLKEYQEGLEKKLPHFIPQIQKMILALESQLSSDFNPHVEKAILIFKTLRLILSLQCKVPIEGVPPLSRCSEIELNFFLYRLLNFNIVVSCWSGLDRTAAAIAFEDSMSQLGEEIFEKFMGEMDHHSSENQFIARVKALKLMFKLLVNFNQYREQLFQLTNVVIGERKISLIQDFSALAIEPTEELNLHQLLFEKIDKQFKQGDFGANQGILLSAEMTAEDLKNTQCYLDLIAHHLLGIRSEITLRSTGVAGLKYHHDINWIKKKFAANPHPLERLPMFIYNDENRIIQLLQYTPAGWISASAVTITPIAISILMRLSQLRGK